MDKVRILRIIEYVGPRDVMEAHMRKTVHGTKSVGTFPNVLEITATTLGEFPEILKKDQPTEVPNVPAS